MLRSKYFFNATLALHLLAILCLSGNDANSADCIIDANNNHDATCVITLGTINSADLDAALNTQLTQINTNTGNIASNTSNITTNSSGIASNTSNISANTTNISSNSSRIDAFENQTIGRFDRIERSVKNVESGVAMAMSMANAPMVFGPGKRLSLSLGAGFFEGHAAGSFRTAIMPNENLVISGTVAADNIGRFSAGMGVGMSF